MKRFALFVLAVCIATVAYAQPEAVPGSDLMNRLALVLEGLLRGTAVGSVAFVVAFVGRLVPFIPNKVLPFLALATNVIGLAWKVIDKFVTAATVPVVASIDPQIYAAGISWSGWRGVVSGCLTAALSAVLLYIQRRVWNDGLKAAVPASVLAFGAGVDAPAKTRKR